MSELLKYHVCGEAPEDEDHDIVYGEKVMPTLGLYTGGAFEFSIQVRVNHCPWCGRDLVAERREWKRRRESRNGTER